MRPRDSLNVAIFFLFSNTKWYYRVIRFFLKQKQLLGFPWQSSGWGFAFQCRRWGFNSWSGREDPTCFMDKKIIKQKQYCNKFDKDFYKMVHTKKKTTLKSKQKFALIHSSDLNTALRKSFYSMCYARFILWEESFVSFIFDDIKQGEFSQDWRRNSVSKIFRVSLSLHDCYFRFSLN